MREGISPLVLLAAVSNLLTEEIERSEYQHLATERFRSELQAFTARVEAELDAEARRRQLRLADGKESVVSED